MEQILTVEINLERPLQGTVDDARFTSLAAFLEREGYVESGSLAVDLNAGTITLRATEKLLKYIENYLR